MNTSQPFEILREGAVTILRPGQNFASLFENDLDAAGISLDLVARLPLPRLVLDLRHVRFIGSAFLGRCVAMNKALAQRPEGSLALCELNSFARAAITVASLHEVLAVYDSCEEAVVALS